MLDGLNSHDLSRAVEFEAESIVNYDSNRPQGVAGKAVELEETASLFTAFPDIQFITHEIFGDGDWVAQKGVLAGTNTGPLRIGKRRIKPTFKRFSSRRTILHKFQDGKIVESHSYYDPRDFSVQLGFINRNVNRTLIVIFVGLGLMTYQTLLVTNIVVYATGIGLSISLGLLLPPFFLGMLIVLSGIRALRKGLIRLP